MATKVERRRTGSSEFLRAASDELNPWTELKPSLPRTSIAIVLVRCACMFAIGLITREANSRVRALIAGSAGSPKRFSL